MDKKKKDSYSWLEMIAIGMGVLGIGFAIAAIGYALTNHH